MTAMAEAPSRPLRGLRLTHSVKGAVGGAEQNGTLVFLPVRGDPDPRDHEVEVDAG